MAEQLSRNTTEIAAGRKLGPSEGGKEQVAVVDWPAVTAFANGDLVSTGIVLRAGTRLLCLPILSCAAGTASTTFSCGLRDATTKVAVDATAIINAASIASAATVALATGTKLINGQRYVLPQDCEVYVTLAGGTPLANQAIRCEIPYLTP